MVAHGGTAHRMETAQEFARTIAQPNRKSTRWRRRSHSNGEVIAFEILESIRVLRRMQARASWVSWLRRQGLSDTEGKMALAMLLRRVRVGHSIFEIT
jgi:hypothetical protein